MQDCSTGKTLFYSANAAAVINDAIGNLTNGGKIFIKAGTYTFTTKTINIGSGNFAAIGTTGISNVELHGEGNSTILKAGVNLNGEIIGGLNANSWNIHDLQIDGNRANQNGACSTNSCNGIYWIGNAITIQRVYEHDAKTDGIVTHGNDNQVLFNWAVNNDADGILFEGGVGSGGLVQGNTVDGASDVGVSMSGQTGPTPLYDALCTENTIRNVNLGISPYGGNTGLGIDIGDDGLAINVTASLNQISNTAFAGIDVSGGTFNRNIIVSQNQLHATGTYSILADHTIGLTMDDNFIDPVTGSGIHVDSFSRNVKILGNTIQKLTGDSIYVFAPYTLISGNFVQGGGLLYANGAGIQVIGNTLLNSTSGLGVELDTACSNCQVKDNFIKAALTCGYAGMFDNGTSATIEGNTITRIVGIMLGVNSIGAYITGNDLRNSTYPISAASCSNSAPTATNLVILNNLGYNSLGHIASPFVSSGNYILDSGGASTPVNKTAMTVWESPKTIMVVTGNYTAAYTLVIQIDGTQVISINSPSANSRYSFELQPGETFYCQYHTSQTTFVVSGQ